MKNYLLTEETEGYVTSQDPVNLAQQFLIAGSKNVLIDRQKKVSSRPGYEVLGAVDTNLTPNRNAWTWDTSTGTELPIKMYDDELEVYLGTIDGEDILAWKRIANGWSTTAKMRATTWFDSAENQDLFLMVIGNANIYEWNGAVAVVDSITGTTITKKGTTTYAQNRFYTTRNKTVVCVRTGTEYTYTGGETTTTLTGIADTTGLVSGDILVQKIVTQTNKPAASRNNHTISTKENENQICVGSEDDGIIYVSNNDNYTDYTLSSPRLTGEGATLTLDEPNIGFASLGDNLLIFSGKHSIYRMQYDQLDIGGTLSETLKIKKVYAGVNQGALNQETIIPIGNSIIYLTNEVALRSIDNPDDIGGLKPRTFSNPIKPDFDAETWDVDDTYATWYKNIVFITVGATSHMYMLNFIEDADGKLTRFWNPPLSLPVGPMAIFDTTGDGARLHGFSNSTPETYLLFEGLSDRVYSGMDVGEKLPIDAKAKYAYPDFGKRANLKSFDEYYVEGEISPSTTELEIKINYDYEGGTQVIERLIDGSNESILEGEIIRASLAQISLGIDPLAGLLTAPTGTRKFAAVLEIAKEDFRRISAEFSTNDVDKYWAIIAHGPNVTLSPRKNTMIHL